MEWMTPRLLTEERPLTRWQVRAPFAKCRAEVGHPLANVSAGDRVLGHVEDFRGSAPVFRIRARSRTHRGESCHDVRHPSRMGCDLRRGTRFRASPCVACRRGWRDACAAPPARSLERGVGERCDPDHTKPVIGMPVTDVWPSPRAGTSGVRRRSSIGRGGGVPGRMNELVIVDLLRRVPLFSEVPEADLRTVAKTARPLTRVKGARIFEEGS